MLFHAVFVLFCCFCLCFFCVSLSILIILVQYVCARMKRVVVVILVFTFFLFPLLPGPFSFSFFCFIQLYGIFFRMNKRNCRQLQLKTKIKRKQQTKQINHQTRTLHKQPYGAFRHSTTKF